MATVFLLLDDAHRIYFELEKYLLPGEARVAPDSRQHPDPKVSCIYSGGAIDIFLCKADRWSGENSLFDKFLLAANGGYSPPERSTRFHVSTADARRLFDFCVTADWKVRIVGDCWNDPPPGYF
jgi:hypothetical protein